MSDKYKKLQYNYQPKIGYDTLIQKVIHKELITIRRTRITYVDIELTVKIGSTKFLESG